MKKNKFTLVLTILSFIFMSIGTTLAFFNSRIIGDNKAEIEAYKFALDLQITSLKSSSNLIPMNDEDYITAYNNNCIDKNGFDACSLYKITLINNGDDLNIDGIMDFTKEDVENMTYAVIDEEENEVISPTKISLETSFSVGENISIANDETKEYYLIIWLSNIKDTGQENIDAGGKFSATIKYNSANGKSLSGTIIQK